MGYTFIYFFSYKLPNVSQGKMTYLFILMTVVMYILITNLNKLLKRVWQMSYNAQFIEHISIRSKGQQHKALCIISTAPPRRVSRLPNWQAIPIHCGNDLRISCAFHVDSVTAYSPTAKDIIIVNSKRFFMSSILIYKYTLLAYNMIYPLCVSGKRATERARERRTAILFGWRQTVCDYSWDEPGRSTEFKLGVHEHHRFL